MRQVVAPVETEPAEFVPYGERCFRGCGRRAVIIDGIARYCPACYMDSERRAHRMAS